MVHVRDSVIVLPADITVGGSSPPRDVRKWKHVVMPEGIERIGWRWFMDSEIESVAIPASVREISANAFRCCRRLREVVFEERSMLTRIGESAFEGCSSLAKIDFPEGLARIGGRCFYKGGLEEVVLPASVRVVEASALENCTRLRSARLNEGLERLGERAFAGSALENIQLLATLKEIRRQTFCGCKSLERVEIPSGAESIGRECFQNSGVQEITLPDTLKEVHEDALSGGGELRTVWVEEGCAPDVRKHVNDNAEIRRK